MLKDLVDFSDMLPTFAELAGAKLPTDRKLDGHSFAPQLHGEKGQPRDWAYVQLNENRYVRSDRWKLTGDGELFDMRDAPFRQIPVTAESSDESSKAARAKLQAVLDELVVLDSPSSTKAKKGKKSPKAEKLKPGRSRRAAVFNRLQQVLSGVTRSGR